MQDDLPDKILQINGLCILVVSCSSRAVTIGDQAQVQLSHRAVWFIVFHYFLFSYTLSLTTHPTLNVSNPNKKANKKHFYYIWHLILWEKLTFYHEVLVFFRKTIPSLSLSMIQKHGFIDKEGLTGTFQAFHEMVT